MQTHRDSDSYRSEFLESLKAKADRMMREGSSQITAGTPEEQPLALWQSMTNGMQVAHMPDDEHKIVRISIGGGSNTPMPLDYCTIRGSVGECILLLEKAIAALRECPS